MAISFQTNSAQDPQIYSKLDGLTIKLTDGSTHVVAFEGPKLEVLEVAPANAALAQPGTSALLKLQDAYGFTVGVDWCASGSPRGVQCGTVSLALRSPAAFAALTHRSSLPPRPPSPRAYRGDGGVSEVVIPETPLDNTPVNMSFPYNYSADPTGRSLTAYVTDGTLRVNLTAALPMYNGLIAVSFAAPMKPADAAMTVVVGVPSSGPLDSQTLEVDW